MKQYYPVLTIAGSDCSGGAGIQADLKTMSALGVYGMSAITAITAQNTTGVTSIQGVSPDMVADQIDMIYSDIKPLAVKTGMLYNKKIIEVVADRLMYHGVKNLVIDPVMMSTSGSKLIDDDAIEVLIERLFPLATLITPNKHEVIRLTGSDNLQKQANYLRKMGIKNFIIKGGDSSRADVKIDYLGVSTNSQLIRLRSKAIETVNTHGTGCTLSSAIASYLALGLNLETSVKHAKRYITRAISAGKDVSIGNGHGPVNHFFAPKRIEISE